MKAILSREPGGPETLTLETVADPAPRRGDVLIRVRACSVNYPDVLIIEDKYQYRPPRPFSPGAEVAGEIVALGEAVDGLRVGQRVIAFPQVGGMAELAVAAAQTCIPLPDGMDFDTGAALVLTYGTSIHALKDRARLQSGEILLVLGAAGGVGLAAVELGKAMGARVIAACSSQAKADLALAHGADSAVVYPAGPFDREGSKALTQLFKSAVGADGADVIYDPVGGDYAEPALRAIGWEGRYLVVGFPAGIPKLALNLTLLKGCQIIGVFWGAFVARHGASHAANIAELLQYWRDGRIRPEISERFPLDRAPEAISRLGQRAASGKLVVTID